MKRFNIRPRKLFSQQLVEFLFVAPFMIVFFGILTEYAYALNCEMTLAHGLNEVTSSMYGKIKPNMSEADIRAQVTADLKSYLVSNNVPTRLENTIEVGYVITGNNVVFIASYMYVSAFTLPVYVNVLPAKMVFRATSMVPRAFLGGNEYTGSIDSKALDEIWASSFSSLDAFNASKKGVMKTKVGTTYPTIDGSTNVPTDMVFMIPVTTPMNKNTYLVVFWDGTLYPYIANIDDDLFYSCTETICTSQGTGVLAHLDSNHYNNILFIHDSDVPSDISKLNEVWLKGASGTAMSDSSVDGVLKRALALVDSASISVGNYDSLKVFEYNPAVSLSNTYTVSYLGSMAFACHSTDLEGVKKFATGKTGTEFGYNFGEKVTKDE